jgi:outer membrane protein OmpA-like peptidoglycan-associated protein
MGHTIEKSRESSSTRNPEHCAMKKFRLLSMIAMFMATATTVIYAQQPILTFTCDRSNYITWIYGNREKEFQDFHGLLIEEDWMAEVYPFTTSIFFDAGSNSIPDRYILFTDPSQTEDFDDSKIPGGTLQKYYHLLNIVGYRLRQHPEATIRIAGYNLRQRKLGETRELSAKRAQAVYDYLMNVWGIDPARITMLRPRDLPSPASHPGDTLGDAEYRRVEITSDNPAITATIVQTDLRRYPMPDTMHFQMNNGIPDSLVQSREIVIARDGRPWHIVRNLGINNRVSPSYNWGKEGNEDSIPINETPYTAQLVVHTKDGRELRSDVVTIPMKSLRVDARRLHCEDCRRRISTYALTLFPFDDHRLDAISIRALRKYVDSDLTPDSKIHITGLTDIIGSTEHNLKLSVQRASVVVQHLLKHNRPGSYASLDSQGAGEDSPLYSNDLPEGRFYNRTVYIRIESNWPTE